MIDAMAGRIAAVVLGACLMVPVSALAESRTEVRDPVRGVSFHSIALSDVPVSSLTVVAGEFSESDRLALGLSAMVMDGSSAVDEYVLWIRHEGRRWLEFDIERPVEFFVDGDLLELQRLRASQPSVGESARFFEKIEFRISEAELERLSQSRRVEVQLRSSNGVVHQVLAPDVLAEAGAFRSALMEETLPGT